MALPKAGLIFSVKKKKHLLYDLSKKYNFHVVNDKLQLVLVISVQSVSAAIRTDLRGLQKKKSVLS